VERRFGNQPFGEVSSRLENDYKMDLREVDLKKRSCSEFVQDREI